jgi:uncharacterized SAM-binding protein YcdF (DUF218 family)
MQQKRVRHWLNNRVVLFWLFGLTVSLPLMFVLADKALIAALPPDRGTPVDAIVVIGRGWQFFHRFYLAGDLLQAKRAPLIFISGINDASIGIDLLKEKGFSNQVLDGENCSLTTEENAVFTAAILQSQGIRRILLITDPPHMWRALLVFRAQGFTVIPKLSPLPSYLGYKAETFMKLREYMGLVSYSVRGLFSSERSTESNKPELVKLLKEAEQYGKQRQRDNTKSADITPS